MTFFFATLIIGGIVLYFVLPGPPEKFVLTEEFKNVIHLLENTKSSLYLSGKAGTGKSRLLQYFKEKTQKTVVVLAPTGIAALNVGGQTIHSFFKFPIGPIDINKIKAQYTRHEMFKKIDILVIDEVSMVSADLMNAIDGALKLNRNSKEPFGGVQLFLIGDLFQLPPVVTNDLRSYFDKHYQGEYFFNAPVFKMFKFERRELTQTFRQKDPRFKAILDRIRIDKAIFDDFVVLNSRHVSNVGETHKGAVYLTTTNAAVKAINSKQLDQLKGKEFVLKAEATGTLKEEMDKLQDLLIQDKISEADFEERTESKFPSAVYLRLKEGAQIIMTKNDSKRRWVNGTVGTIIKYANRALWVQINDKAHQIEQEEWKEFAYEFDEQSGRVVQNERGSYKQYPLKLAWALTIHKSQGKTYEKVVVDLGTGAFAHGQTYVALSRCKTLEGIKLVQELKPTDIIVDRRVKEFCSSEVEQQQKVVNE